MARTMATRRSTRTTAQAQRHTARNTGIHTQAQQSQPPPIPPTQGPTLWRKSPMPMHRHLFELLYPWREELSDDYVMSVAVNISTIIKATNFTPIDNERITVAITSMRAAVMLEDEEGGIKIVLAEPRLQFGNGVAALGSLASKAITKCLRGAPDSDTPFKCGMWVVPGTQQGNGAGTEGAVDEDDDDDDDDGSE